MKGSFLGGDYEIDGARNIFTSKTAADVSAANKVLGALIGSVNAAWTDGTMSASIAKKGKVKVSGIANGVKLSATSQLLVGEKWCCIPVVPKKGDVAFAVWMSKDGNAIGVIGVGDKCEAGKPGELRTGSKFFLDKGAQIWAAGTFTEYLPVGLDVVQDGKKWIVANGAKAGKVAFKKGTTEVDTDKLGVNPSSLKLSYKMKDGSFKGAFKVYVKSGSKLKSAKASVVGVMVRGEGYGTATVKGVGSTPVAISPVK